MVNKQRYQTLLNTINQYNSGDKGITRIAYTNEEQACTHAFIRLCKRENLEVRLDACANLIARRAGSNNSLSPVVMGSHLDTVYQGGKYDGAVGVTAALEIIRRLNEKGVITEHPIEIISFACEESSRFGVSTVGSKAMAGLIEKEKYRDLQDRDGITMEKSFELCALDFNSIHLANRTEEKFEAFFELHIEQGPVLEKENKQVGIVTGIAAPTRLIIKLFGKASHSGTTPMNMRKDALLGASEITLELEKLANQERIYGSVATVGVMKVHHGAMNVVPGEVEMNIDIRSSSIESRNRILHHLFKFIALIENKRGLQIECKEISKEEPVKMSPKLNDVLKSICEEKKLSYKFMQSGAGHDAMNMIKLGPTGLIFIPSVDGVSHHPDEFSNLEDILIGIELLEAAVLHYAKANPASLVVGG